MSGQKKKYFYYNIYSCEFKCFSSYYRNILSKHFYMIEDIAKQLEQFDQRNVCQLYINVNDDFYKSSLNIPVKKLSKENPRIASASASVEIKSAEKNGRGLYAVKKIPEKERIIVEKATVLQVNPLCVCEGTSESLYRCHYCALPVNSFLTCYSCDVVIYCSAKCQKEDYIIYHQFECLGIQNHFWSMEPTSCDYIALKMMLYGAYNNFNTTDPNVGRYGDEKDNYPTVYKLCSNFIYYTNKEVNDILYSTLRTLIYLMRKTQFFEIYCKECEVVDSIDFQAFVGGMLFLHHTQALNNQIILNFPNNNLEIHFNCVANRGKAICTTVSLLNHSCRPNACLIVNNDTVIVRAIRNIQPSEEITISYYEISPIFSYFERQLITQAIFYFVCKCERCIYEKRMHNTCKNCGFSVIDGVDFRENVNSCDNCKISKNNVDGSDLVIKLLVQLYNKTGELKYVKQLYEFCNKDNKFLPQSQMIFNVGLFLCNKYMHLFLYDQETDDPLTILTFFMSFFEKIKVIIPKYSKFYVAGKIQFYHRFLNHVDKFDALKPVSSKHRSVLQKFMKDIEKLEKEIKFFLPKSKMNFYYTILRQAERFSSATVCTR